ncbi:TPA: hypothetical protein QB325_001661 [Pasteurella multocida]|nr:hypothetical protein [Pasteurella multocida]HEA3267324.1 hypothetical protein [Pasteurella multocida]
MSNDNETYIFTCPNCQTQSTLYFYAKGVNNPEWFKSDSKSDIHPQHSITFTIKAKSTPEISDKTCTYCKSVLSSVLT